MGALHDFCGVRGGWFYHFCEARACSHASDTYTLEREGEGYRMRVRFDGEERGLERAFPFSPSASDVAAWMRSEVELEGYCTIRFLHGESAVAPRPVPVVRVPLRALPAPVIATATAVPGGPRRAELRQRLREVGQIVAGSLLFFAVSLPLSRLSLEQVYCSLGALLLFGFLYCLRRPLLRLTLCLAVVELACDQLEPLALLNHFAGALAMTSLVLVLSRSLGRSLPRPLGFLVLASALWPPAGLLRSVAWVGLGVGSLFRANKAMARADAHGCL